MKYMFNSTKMFFLFFLFFSTLISISSNSWLGCWMGLEINLLSFIPLISKSNNLLNSEASLKYFLTQSIASINFLFSILLMFMFNNFLTNYLFMMLINSSLLMKMGSTPFHFWFPNVMEGLSWFNCFILMIFSWQKISPIILLSYFMNMMFIMFMMILNSIIGSLGSFNQLSLRKLLAFSSINNIGRMLVALMLKLNTWMIYLIIYSFLNFILMFMFKIMNMFTLNQIYSNKNSNFMKYFIMFNLLSLSGLPPFLGFLPKWLIINLMIDNNLIMTSFILIMMSLVNMYFYIRITYTYFMFNFFEIKFYSTQFDHLTLISIFTFISLLGLMLIPMLIH
uniref:NADH-ubiquinone oxidoreductase chain 2 n=1 Tax=Hydatophylax nigrovittatus TaxID=1310303 RepID=A0A4Y1JWK3_9NEOP|nr:NADH dehydrogenase subunit 2 [Hydatophylax nigrovittatus]APQ47877.1 NADH dehydrogenase subunit 2 [Hydatophylax nigrovittatus]